MRGEQGMDDHPEIDALEACRAVLPLVGAKVANGQIDHVVNTMPKDIQSLWPEPTRRRAEAAQLN